MKIIAIFVTFMVFYSAYPAREVSFDSFEYSPKESDLIGYGNLRLLRSKAKKNTFNLKGNFTVKRQIGNEKLVTFEIWTRTGALMIRNTYAFCEFTRIEKLIWPELVKVSNMPQDNPCPFPEVHYLFWQNFLII
jgi:hypothetical protein